MATRTTKQMAENYQSMMEQASAYIAVKKPVMSQPSEVAAFMGPVVQGMEQEGFFILLLNTKNALIKMVTATIGIVDRTLIHPREVFRQAILENATRIILTHNHPSGDSTPSVQDISSNRQIVEAGKIIGIEILDHVVIGQKIGDSKGYTSFRESNLM